MNRKDILTSNFKKCGECQDRDFYKRVCRRGRKHFMMHQGELTEVGTFA